MAINYERLAVSSVVGVIVVAGATALGWWLVTPIAPATWRALVACGVAALSMPLAFIYVRHNVRLQRLRILAQCSRVFEMDAPRRDERGVEISGGRGSPSFEYVVEKYVEDLPKPLRARGGAPRSSRLANEVSQLKQFSEGDHDQKNTYDIDRPWWALGSSWALLMAAMPLVLLTTLGFYAAFAAVAPDAVNVGLRAFWEPLLVVGGRGGASGIEAYRDNVLTIAVAAFIGAYSFSLGAVSRAVATFDLSPFSMLRLAVNMVAGVSGAVIAYRAFPDLLPNSGPGLPPPWILFAFISGLVPDLIINWLSGKAQDVLGGKVTDSGVLRNAPAVSPEIIDGIDFFTRFRLQQANVYEVQSLAVANPIMLFVETPYGLYQCIDWVAQAQLCTIVGPERFLMMRRYNLRTIFDVERAVLSEYTTSQLRRFVVGLMMSTPPAGGAAGWSFWGGGDLGLPPEPPLESPPEAVGGYPTIDSPAFCKYLMDSFCEPAIGPYGEIIDHDPDRTLKQLGRLVIDDLHVHRLRDVWLLVQQRLGPSGDALPDTEKPWLSPMPYGFFPRELSPPGR